MMKPRGVFFLLALIRVKIPRLTGWNGIMQNFFMRSIISRLESWSLIDKIELK